MKRWLVATCLIALVGCVHATTPQASTAPNSGVRGRVVFDRSCPVAGTGSTCHDRPWKSGLVQAWTSSGNVVGSVRTNRNGRFLLPLAPGTYTVIPANAEGPATAGRAVTVTAGALVTVALRVPS